MKPFLLPVLLLAACLSATAQPNLAAPQPRTAADTVAAVQRLFMAKRKACNLLVGSTAVVAGAGALVALSQPAPPRSGGGFDAGIDGRPIMATLIMVGSLPIIGIELLTCGGWGRRAEQRALAAAQAHRLPSALQRKLKPAYFAPAQ
jgi:hypothetical protein